MKRNPIIRWCLSLLLGLAFAPAWSGPVSLNGTWELSYWKQPAEAITDPAELKEVEVKTIPAQVPGNVHVLRRGLPGGQPEEKFILANFTYHLIFSYSAWHTAFLPQGR